MKSRFLTVAGLALAAAAICGPLAAQSFPSAHWKSKVQMEGGPQGDMTTDSEIWMKDKSMRMKTLAMGMNVNIIKSGDFMYQWQEGQTTGMKLPANMRRGGGSDYVNKIDEVRAKGKKIGTETVDGHKCDVYEYETTRERMGKVKETFWLASDLKSFPIKYVMESGSMKMTSVNSAIEIPASVSEAMLTPPKDVEFQDMSEMMKGMMPPKSQ